MRRVAAFFLTLGLSVALVVTGACSERPGPALTRFEAQEISTERYTWLASWSELPPSVGLETRFPTPAGATRVGVDEGSYGEWLRELPVRLDRRSVEDYSGRTLTFSKRWSAAVVSLDVGDKNLQQCADTILRLHAEWLWSQGRRDELAYHFTSGDETRFADWTAGRRLVVEGSAVRTASAGEFAAVSPDRAALRAWLDQVFMYAGTRSLALDSEAVAPGEPLRPGDFIVRPGSPGHAVVILDVAAGALGEELVLVGQGSMPAQELHVLRGDRDSTVDGVWFRLSSTAAVIPVPGWGDLERSKARRMTPAESS